MSYFGSLIVTVVYWILRHLWLYRHVRSPIRGGAETHIYAHWHGDELLLIGAVRRPMVILVSHSRDGKMLTRIMRWLGFSVARGSSTRGGAGGLKGLIDAVKEGCDASLAVDGPKGPIYKVKPGVLKLAQETGCPIIPVAAAASHRYVFRKAWNRCYLPLPFAKCVIVYGEPMSIPAVATDPEFEDLRFQLEQRLISLKVEAEADFERVFKPEVLEISRVGA